MQPYCKVRLTREEACSTDRRWAISESKRPKNMAAVVAGGIVFIGWVIS